MDYSTVLSKFSDCMTEIGNALRKANGTTQKYKLTDVANAIKEGTQVYKVGSVSGVNTTFNIKSLFPEVNYAELTSGNFVFACTSANGGGPDANNAEDATWHPRNSASIGLSYNSETGILTVKANFSTAGSGSFTTFKGNVLLIIGKIK